VRICDPGTGTGTDGLFNELRAPAVRWAIEPRSNWYDVPKSWQQLMQNSNGAKIFLGLEQIVEYDALYRELLGSSHRA